MKTPEQIKDKLSEVEDTMRFQLDLDNRPDSDLDKRQEWNPGSLGQRLWDDMEAERRTLLWILAD